MRPVGVFSAVIHFVLALSISALGSARQDDSHSDAANSTARTGTIVGELLDSNGDKLSVNRVTVFLCDAETGIPIHRGTKRPIQASIQDPQLDEIWYAEAVGDGRFAFADAATGTYRLVAQSWSDGQAFIGFGPDRKPSDRIILHGVVERVHVHPEQETFAVIRPLGSHTLRIVNDPAEPHALLLISLRPTLGDGILGPYGWGTEFLRNLIGVTQMEEAHVTIAGLPESAAVHVGLLNYDDNPGVGAASYAADQAEGKLRIVATWSNGHKDPPAELSGLTQHLIKEGFAYHQFAVQFNSMPDDEGAARAVLFERLVAENDAQVDVAGFGRVRLADLLAATLYVQMNSPQMNKARR
jgi:hypothetical protein